MTKTDPRVEAAKTDAKAYMGRTTGNLRDFEAFVAATTGIPASLRTSGEREAFALGVRAAGLYSRYQAAKRDGLLDAILSAGKPAPRKVAPKVAPKSVPAAE